MSSTRLARKVLLIGWDAADWKMIHPLLDAGLMPALQRLVERGVMGNLATLDPPLSPMLWTSIATGQTADRHGILGFTQPREDGQGIRPVLGTSRRVKALWNILSQNSLRSNVVGWWPSHPAEPVRGAMVSNFFHRATAPYGEPWPLPEGVVHPERLRDTLAELRVHPAEITGAHVLPFVPDAAAIDPEKDPRLSSLAKILADSASVQAAATYLMEHEDWDFMAVYFDAIDHFGHGFMRFHPPQMPGVPNELFQRYRHVMHGAYRWHDMMLERLLDLAGEDTTVILISDHGFHSDHLRPRSIPREPAGPAVEHRNHGIYVMAGPHVKQDERISGATLLDVAPTVLSLFGLPSGRDMAGQPLVQAFTAPVPVTRIDSWEDVAGEAGMHPPERRVDPWAEQEALQQLVALGYVEPPGEDTRKTVEHSVNESQFYLARVYLSTGRPKQAQPVLEALWANDPDQLRYGQRLAECYLAQNRLKACRRTIEQLVAADAERRRKAQQEAVADPQAPSAEAEGQESRSTRDARLAKPSPVVDQLMGTLLLAEGHPTEALPLLLRAEDADLPRPVLHLRIGEAYLQSHHWHDAVRAFNKALTIDPHQPEAHHGVARALLAQGRDEAAAEAALRAVSLRPFFPHAHFHLGQALQRLESYERAAQAFEVCVQQAPGMSAAHRQLSRLYMWHLGQPAKAAYHEQFVRERIVPASPEEDTSVAA